jgi:transmembrane E3 ubiquitin-protein ligase
LQNLIILPQIVHNVRIGNNPGFSGYYVLGFLGLRFMLPLYERACPGNHFILAPMYGLVIALGLIYVIQVNIMKFLDYNFVPSS